MQKVLVKHYDENLDLVDEEFVSLGVYCLKLAQKTMRILYDIEDINLDKVNPEKYKAMRHAIFDICGSLQRLPNDLY